MAHPQPPTPLLRVRPAPTPPSPTAHRADVSSGDANVLSRLHALFNSHASPTGDGLASDAGSLSLSRAKTSAATGGMLSPQVSPGTVIERDNIKILVVTWNMGDALPKGDLSVLFGDVPNHVPSSPSPTIPQLPRDNIHPYHIVVVAGQECPTHSGVPRGLGGGIMKGVHVRAAHRKEKEERKKEKEEEAGASLEDGYGGLRTPQMETDEDAEDDSRSATPSAASSTTPVMQKHQHQQGNKGWSTMLDDWFCGPVAREEKTTLPGATPPAGESPILPPSAPSSVPPPLDVPLAPGLVRSSSAPGVIPSSNESMLVPPQNITAGALTHSPLARSVSSSASESSASSPEENHSYLAFQTSPSPPSPGPLRPKPSTTSRRERPAIVIPNDEPERTRDGEKCYFHLVKERLMGMYLSVYVYKGCEHLVQGVDKDFVTAGLAGGRVGNKGGIGISLKLADHRFLFVNSHLAAHSARVSARLANIAKIKSELRLDCFLPKDDPRASFEDITDRFDSVFWCGDLNFRLDLSRLHAEWLVEQKKYDEALMWDQLRAAMRDPEKNPFPGFHEHVIDFPPTFKYDVWRSIKATNRELRRSLRRRGTLEGRNARRPSVAELGGHGGANPALSHVPEADTEEHEEGHERDAGNGSDDDVRTIASRRSFESSGAGGYTSAGPSTAGTDAEDDEGFSTPVDASAYGSRHKALEVALKEKTKKFLGLVKMDKVLSPSPSRRKLARAASIKRKEKPEAGFDFNSRRTSVSSLASLEPSTPILAEIPGRISTSSNRSIAEHALGPPRRPSDASWMSTSPNQPTRRRFSVLKRTVSSRSSNNDGRSADSHEPAAAEDIDDNVDYREGVYDSSKKQRVPSWCDRVLWKSVITPDPDPQSGHPPSMHDSAVHERGSKGFGRLSHAFANLGEHLKLSMTRTGSIDTPERANLHLNRSLPPTPPAESPVEYVASPETSPALRATSTLPNGDDHLQSPLRRSPATGPATNKSPVRARLTSRSRSGSAAAHPLLDANSVLASPPAFPKITFDPALPADADRSEVPTSRRRANSASIPGEAAMSSKTLMKRSLSASSHNGITIATLPQPHANRLSDPEPQRALSSGSLGRRTKTLEIDPSPPMARPPPPNHISTGSIPGLHGHHTEDRNSFVKFIKDLPGWLHVRSMPHHDVAELPVPQSPLVRPRRHQRGEVDCLHYGTIDDAGMRQLEGRSDHRPAIFAATVYVGD